MTPSGSPSYKLRSVRIGDAHSPNSVHPATPQLHKLESEGVKYAHITKSQLPRIKQ
jgi:hypothetical protein